MQRHAKSWMSCKVIQCHARSCRVMQCIQGKQAGWITHLLDQFYPPVVTFRLYLLWTLISSILHVPGIIFYGIYIYMVVCYRISILLTFKSQEISLSYSELSESCTIADFTNHLEPIVYKYNSIQVFSGGWREVVVYHRWSPEFRLVFLCCFLRKQSLFAGHFRIQFPPISVLLNWWTRMGVV